VASARGPLDPAMTPTNTRIGVQPRAPVVDRCRDHSGIVGTSVLSAPTKALVVEVPASGQAGDNPQLYTLPACLFGEALAFRDFVAPCWVGGGEVTDGGPSGTLSPLLVPETPMRSLSWSEQVE